MARRSDITVQNDGVTPRAGVYITVKKADGTLASLTDDSGAALTQPLQSGLDGSFYYNAADGIYTEEFRISLLGAATKIGTVVLASSNASVTLEQFGGSATTGFNNQPAFQRAVNAVQGSAGATISLGGGTYELRCPTRTTDPAYGFQVADGICIYITGSLRIVGIPGRTVLKFLNSSGGTNDTISQVVNGQNWRGHGLVFNPATTVDGLHLEGFEMDGTKAYYYPGAPTNAQSDISHKGVVVNPVTGDFKKLTLKNLKVHNFGGELYYLGGSATSVIEAYECEGYNSNQSAWNPTGLGRVVGYDPYMHDSYLPSEIISGQGHDYFGGKFANGYNAGAIGTQFFAGGYPYDYPNRDNTKAPPWVKYHGTEIVNIAQFNFASWTKAWVTMVDSQGISGAGGRDIYVDADFIMDQGTATACLTLSGPATTTTQIPGAPVGTYYAKLQSSLFKIRVRRTAKAIAAGFTNITGVSIQPGLIDNTSVRVQLEGEMRYTMFTSGTPVSGQVYPKIDVGDLIPLEQPFGGTYDGGGPSSDTNYTPNYLAVAIGPSAGPINLGMANSYAGAPYAVSDGQIFTIYHNGTNGNIGRLKANGPLLALREDRYLVNKGDYIQLRWNAQIGAWEEYYYASSSARTWFELNEATAASIPTPPTGKQYEFIDSADHKLKRKDSSGTVTVIA